MGERNFQNMISLLDNLRLFESLLFQENLVSDELEDLLTSKPLQDDGNTSSINYIRATCLSVLRSLQISLEGLSLPDVRDERALMNFCFENASLIFCTTSSSYKLHRIKMEPLNILVIDEAAQLKEAESTIPLQLPGMKHAILIGDECQLPAMLYFDGQNACGQVCIESGFGRSLFERLSALANPKHLLNVQYLPGPMFGPYSFINVVGGREEKDDDDRSWRNLVEVAVVMKIVQNVYKAGNVSKEKLTIGVVSTYSAQVVSIQEKLAHKYEKLDGFSVRVKSIDGFQGGEEDIIILSTVRSNSRGSVGFISSPQRTNVALTRARHCLWILGNERTLLNSESVWTDLVHDARNRHSLFDADSDDSLKMTIIAAKKELEQLDDLVNGNSVLFSDDFRRSFGKLTCARLKKLVLNLLLKLSGGWQPKSRSEGECMQVMKVWDILTFEEIPKLTKRLESIFAAYTDNYINRCTAKCLEGNLEVPRCWPPSQEVIRFRIYEPESSEIRDVEPDDVPENRNPSVLRQLFVTVSPRLCHAVKQHVSHLTSSSIDINLDDVDVTSDFSDVPDTFCEVPIKNYPLVITFHKFLMMLDSTLGNSFFGRFREAREGSHAQTIARGIDFRFQDIRSLFYKEFLSNRTSGKQEKGLVSEIFQLKQNFRTHAGVLDLTESVIEILYCYFVHSMDILEPETSLISGEAPVLLESGNDENAIVTIFGDTGTSGEIVILVRDDCAKAEICDYIGKNALVLTIVECKGLEFQDVLLYNFFGTSPLKDQWRVIYGYMKDHDWLDEKYPQSFPPFKEAKHSVLCSELKQLYVAITRTRQRLWICENQEELSKPMFDYRKMRGLVQVRKLDDSVAQAMRVASSPQEWRERGKKLFYENNFVMATMCFERAGDTIWEKLAKASGLRASAEQIRGTNHEAFQSYVREAAGIFESIGKLEPAASCYCDLAEYERAGKIYLYKCGKMDAAAECFTLAGCYSDAAEAYAKGDKLSNCLSDDNLPSKEIEQIEQEFLESCALDYHGHKDLKSMMKFVRAFFSMESKRLFLRSLGCLDELLLLEEESGHFFEAAELARSWGNVLREADLMEKAGDIKEATALLLWYVFLKLLWGNGNRCWPLKQFDQKEELSSKVKSLAELDSEFYYDFVCSELKVISGQCSTLPELKEDLHAYQKSGSLKGKYLSIRKLLDAHFQQHFSKYEWEDELPIGINEHCDKIFENKVSVRTLVFYWKLWKENVVEIFESLGTFDNEEPNKLKGPIDFSLMYFGVRKQHVKGNMVYLLVDEDAEWVRNYGQKGLLKVKKRVIIDGRQLVIAIRSYWQSELFSVGIKVLEVLEGLRKSKSSGSAFHQSTSLLHLFEVSRSLLDCQYLNLTNSDTRKLQRFLGISLTLVQIALCELRSLSNLFAASRQEAEIPDIMKRMEVAIDWLQSNRPKIDDFLKRYAMSQESKAVQMVVPESSITTQVEETGDKKNQDEETGDALQVEPMLEKQTSGGNTQDAKNKKGKDDNTKGDNNKGNNNKGKNSKGKKGKKGKGKKK
ncbi:uvrD-like Helicase, ATP-binding domain, P-loop containing nucleoside triphosphate hydrolase [Artemisia annua]|uniref:UvrD-like Helicase, ATP-binding domain, P-loop containing nucleoside triphosphate hydrolase n=1 Tax=Artemisia annua TaxID=35608 RepID=A0A2U1M3C3_ARTAN|nr:uvrD-like Helicase, ATP-binding domain, P-loop containing nucleoside triphosphate hydrolase [Artemisia annua]